MTKSRTLVLGSTGRTGARVVHALHAAGYPVRSAGRAGPVRFDWAEPDTWEPALSGITGVYLMAPDGMPVDPAFVDCAVRLGVRRIVLLSSMGIETMADERLLAAERVVQESTVEWTVLRPDWFNQNFDEGFFAPEIRAGTLRMPLGELRQCFVDADDIAAVAAAALTGDGHAGQCYEVTGPKALTFGEAVETIARATGRPLRYLGTEQDYLAAQSAAGAPEEQTRAVLDAFAALRAAGAGESTDVVRRVTGRAPKDFETFATQAHAAGAWS